MKRKLIVKLSIFLAITILFCGAINIYINNFGTGMFGKHLSKSDVELIVKNNIDDFNDIAHILDVSNLPKGGIQVERDFFSAKVNNNSFNTRENAKINSLMIKYDFNYIGIYKSKSIQCVMFVLEDGLLDNSSGLMYLPYEDEEVTNKFLKMEANEYEKITDYWYYFKSY